MICYIANAPDSGAALYNTFKEVNDNISLEGQVFDRNALCNMSLSELRNTLKPFDVLVFDSPYCMNLILNAFTFLSHSKKFITWWHINDTEEARQQKQKWIVKWQPDQVWVTDSQMADEVLDLGESAAITLRPRILPLLIDKGRFKKGPAPKNFTVGYLGIDKPHKRWGAIHQAVAQCNTVSANVRPFIDVLASTRSSHEGGEYVGREQEFYDAISVYVAPSAHESGPLPPIEALQCGKPVVVTPVGMMPMMADRTKACVLTEYDLSTLENDILKIQNNYETYYTEAQAFDFVVDYTIYEDALNAIK